jgi:hypothetical protein
MITKKLAEYMPGDLDDVRANPIAYGLPDEATIWTDEQIMAEMSKFADPNLVGASKKTADYQGWKNYATWGVALMLGNEEGSYRQMQEKMSELIAGASEHKNVKENIWSAKEAIRFEFADWIKNYVEEMVSGIDNPMASQILQAGMSEVDWQEIADSELDSTDEFAGVPDKEKTSSVKRAEYNGWVNYETWAVALWIDNDQKLNKQVASWCQGEEGVKDDYEIAQRIKSLVEEGNPLGDQATLYADLMNAALSEVNYRDITNHYLEAYKTASKKTASKDRFGRTWDFPKNELCPKCGQPDSVGDCNHKKLPDDQVLELGGKLSHEASKK